MSAPALAVIAWLGFNAAFVACAVLLGHRRGGHS